LGRRSLCAIARRFTAHDDGDDVLHDARTRARDDARDDDGGRAREPPRGDAGDDGGARGERCEQRRSERRCGARAAGVGE